MAQTKYLNLYHRLVSNMDGPETLDQNENGCWPWRSLLNRYGYGQLNVRINGSKLLNRRSHRLMAEIVAGRALCKEEETVEHICGLRRCGNPDHFGLFSRSENTVSAQAKRFGNPTPVPMPLPSAPDDENWLARFVGFSSPGDPPPF